MPAAVCLHLSDYNGHWTVKWSWKVVQLFFRTYRTLSPFLCYLILTHINFTILGHYLRRTGTFQSMVSGPKFNVQFVHNYLQSKYIKHLFHSVSNNPACVPPIVSYLLYLLIVVSGIQALKVLSILFLLV